MKCWNFTNLLSHHVLKFQDQESLTDLEYTALHVAKKIFSVTQGLELVESFD